MDVEPLLESLRGCGTDVDRDKALDGILSILTDPTYAEALDELSSQFLQKGVLDDLISIVNNPQHTIKVAQILAEVAKAESSRAQCVEKGFVPVFLKVLQQNEDITSMTQACRALGNMCYENDASRDVVDVNDGIATLLGLLRSLLSNKDPEVEKLRTIACGFLLNLTNSNEVLQQKAIQGGALDLVGQYLQQFRGDEGLCNMVLVTVASLTDSEVCKEKLMSSSLCSALVDFLRTPQAEIHYETVLEILIALSEWDEVKDALAATDLSNFLIQMAQINLLDDAEYTEDDQQRVKMASDLLILLLTGEKSMELLFDNGKGEIFSTSLKWLESSDEHLQLSGALAIGNFARSDEHCKFLMEQGVASRLLALLKPVYGETKSTLEHAALSALRNLAIPASNKAALIKAGVIEAVLVLVDNEMLAVIFKLLGVLRMLVDGQEEAAIRLGQDREFVTRLVEWSACEEHPGVKGEATRLMAWIIKNARTEDVMRNIVRADGIPHLVSMATSEHVVMQNESLVALSLISATVLADAALALKESELTETLLTLLKDEKTLPEILCNTLTLTRTICTAGNLREELVNSGIADVVRQLASHEEEKVRDAAKSVLTYIDEVPSVER